LKDLCESKVTIPEPVAITHQMDCFDCPKHGIYKQNFYKWQNKYGGMDISNAKRLRLIEHENRGLRRPVADH